MEARCFVAFMILLNFYFTNAAEVYNGEPLSIPKVIGEGHCIWYNQCSDNPDKPSKKLNCRYDGPPIYLLPSSVPLLTATCPELVEEIIDTYGEVVTCCGPDQIIALANGLVTLTIMVDNCPACVSNLRKNFCYSTCHPRHSAFMNPTRFLNDSVWTVTQYSSYTYINDSYDSCDTVYFEAIDAPALAVMCGVWGVDDCSPERMFDNFGNNALVSFNVSYVYGNENTTAPIVEDSAQSRPIYPFNVKTHPCNSENPQYNCDCNNCEESCPVA